MPRIVDHDQRRAELAQAVWALIRERGLSGVTIRNLSQQSGWSSGAIRHYLPNREAILTFAAQQVNERAEARLRGLFLTGDYRQNFLLLLHATLPLDEETRVWMEVWLAFVGAATSDPNFADTQGVLYRRLNRLFLDIFQNFQELGWLPQRTPAEAATELHALLDGLSVHLLLGVVTPEQATRVLEGGLDRLILPPAGGEAKLRPGR